MSNTVKRRQTGFAQISNKLLEDTSLKAQSRFLYSYLYSRPHDWVFHNSQLCKVVGCNEDTLRRYLKELKQSGWIEVNQVRENGVFKNNEYVINTVPSFSSDGDDSPSSEKPESVKTRIGKTTGHNNTNSNNNTDIHKQEGLFPDEIDPKKKTLFKNSAVKDFDVFQKKFDEPDFKNVDLMYYFGAVRDWSDSANKKRTAAGWIATARSFMRGDKQKGKLVLVVGQEEQNQKIDKMSKFLNRS